MNSNRPYLLRALYDWICDNRLTPYVLVDARGADLCVPPDFVQDNTDRVQHRARRRARTGTRQ